MLYLVNITLSAVVLSTRWTAVIAALSIGGFGVLFFLPGAEHTRAITDPSPQSGHGARRIPSPATG